MNMSVKCSVVILALCVTACSRGDSTQTPAQSGTPQPATPPTTTTPAAPPATPEGVPPAAPGTATTPPPQATGAALERSTPASPASTPATAAPATAAPAATAPAATAPAATRAPTATDRPVTEAKRAASDKVLPPEKPAPVVPEYREVTIPSGTALSVRLGTSVASDTSTIEDTVRGTLTKDIIVSGVTAVPAGTEVIGTVRDAKRSGRVKGRASIAFRFERLLVRNEPVDIRTATISRQAATNRRKDVEKGAIGAGAGAIIGGLLGGGKGAAIGAGAGGAGAVVTTRGEEVRLASGTTVRTTLQAPVTITVPRRAAS